MKLKLLLLPLFLVSVALPVYATHEYVLDLESGSSQYAYVNNDLGISVSTARTYNVWFKVESNPTTVKQVIFDHTEDTGNVSYMVDYMSNTSDGSNTRIRFSRDRDGIGGATIFYSVDLVDSAWHFVTATYDGTNIELFLDGTSVAGPTQDVGNGNGSTYGDLFQIGKLSYYAGQYYDGLMDDVSVYSDELTPTEISTLYGDGCTVATADLVSLWELENDYVDGQGTFDLTAGNSPTFVTELEHGCTGTEPPVTSTTTATSTASFSDDEQFVIMIAVFFMSLIGIGLLYSPFKAK